MQTQPFIFKGPVAGGNGGSGFDDTTGHVKMITGIQEINIRAGRYIDSIQVTYYLQDGTTWVAPAHGGNGGNAYTINFAVGETIYLITGMQGAYIDSLTIYTVTPDGKTHAYGTYGGSGGDSFFAMYGATVALYGNSGTYLDALGVYNIVYPVSQ